MSEIPSSFQVPGYGDLRLTVTSCPSVVKLKQMFSITCKLLNCRFVFCVSPFCWFLCVYSLAWTLAGEVPGVEELFVVDSSWVRFCVFSGNTWIRVNPPISSDRTLDLFLVLEKSVLTGLIWSARSNRALGKLEGGCSLSLTLSLLPVTAGLQVE